MSIYDETQSVASDLMAEFSQGTVILRRPGTPTPGANEWDEPTPGAPQTWTLDATVRGVSSKYVNGDTVLATDLEVVAAVFAGQPRAGDTLSIDGRPVTIVQIIRIPAAGTMAAWRLIVRG